MGACNPQPGSPPFTSPQVPPSPIATPKLAGRITPGLVSATQGLDVLQSYRAHLVIEYNGTYNGQPAGGTLQSLTEVTRQPSALHRYFKAQTAIPGAKIPAGISEFFRVNNQVYSKQGDTGTGFTFTDPTMTPDRLGFFELNRLIILPPTVVSPPREEKLNRFNVHHYTFNEKDLSDPNVTFKKAEGDMWLAIPGNYLVQYVISATLHIIIPDPKAHILDEGQISLRYTLSDINTTPPITPPADRLTTASPLLTFPRLPDAETVSVFPTMVEYTSTITPVEAVLFYRDELTRADWTEQSNQAFNEKAQLIFTQKKQMVTVIINPAGQPGKIRVLLHLNSPPQ